MTYHNGPICIWVHGVPSFMYRGHCVHGPFWWKSLGEGVVEDQSEKRSQALSSIYDVFNSQSYVVDGLPMSQLLYYLCDPRGHEKSPHGRSRCRRHRNEWLVRDLVKSLCRCVPSVGILDGYLWPWFPQSLPCNDANKPSYLGTKVTQHLFTLTEQINQHNDDLIVE